jgi:hypothetical protein
VPAKAAALKSTPAVTEAATPAKPAHKAVAAKPAAPAAKAAPAKGAKGAKASEQQPNAWHHRKNFHQNQTKAQNKPKKARAQPILTHHQVPLFCLRWLSYKQ